jgi:drug/metabolite transporter (DMT)-like permease
MGELLSLTSALCFGITEFVSGLLSRRFPGVTVALHAQAGGTVLTVLLAALWPASGPASAGAWGWAALSGLGTGVGVAFLFRATGSGPMSVVVPIAAVGGATLPVVAGLLLLGERPSATALVGIGVALPAIWLVSRPRAARSAPVTGVRDALVSGCGFAVQFLAMSGVDLGAGMWPVVLSRVVSVLVIVLLVRATEVTWQLPRRASAIAMASGAVGSAAIVCFLLATRAELVSIATVLASLYPVVPVVLALFALRERVTVTQATGLVAAAAAVSLVVM